jgi:hypothetical protein
MEQFEPEQLRNLEHVRDHIQSLSLRPEKLSREDDNMTLDQYVRQLGANDNTSQLVNVWSKVMHGVESTQQSAAFFIDYCRRNKGLLAIRADDHTGGQYLRLPDGEIPPNTGRATWLGWLTMSFQARRVSWRVSPSFLIRVTFICPRRWRPLMTAAHTSLSSPLPVEHFTDANASFPSLAHFSEPSTFNHCYRARFKTWLMQRSWETTTSRLSATIDHGGESKGTMGFS